MKFSVNRKNIFFGIIFIILVLFFVTRFVVVDGKIISKRIIVQSVLKVKNESVVSNYYSVSSADYILSGNCANDKTEALDLFLSMHASRLQTMNLSDEIKQEALQYEISNITTDGRFFGFPSEYTKEKRIDSCSYLQNISENKSSRPMFATMVRPITKESVKDIAYYFWARHHFGFPHFITESSHEDSNFYHYLIYFGEPKRFSGSDLGGCDYVELVKKEFQVDKKTGEIIVNLVYPQVFIKTGVCHEPVGLMMGF